MKNGIISALLLLVLSAYLIIPVLPVIDYLVNKDYIAKNLCINKDKPKSCCKGKCHMVKQLQKTNPSSDNDTKSTNKRVQLKELNDFIVNNPCRLKLEITSVNYQKYSIPTYFELAGSAVFVPPKPGLSLV